MLARDYRDLARENLKGKWKNAFFFTAVFLLLSALVCIPFLGIVLGLIFIPIMLWGFQISFYDFVMKGQSFKVSKFFVGLKSFFKIWGFYFMIDLYISLWSLLFCIPGIVKTFSYSMAPYILYENPDIGINEAIRRSRDLMQGHKGSLFCLSFSFIGWFLLPCFVLLFGILALIFVSTRTIGIFLFAIFLLAFLVAVVLLQLYYYTAHVEFYKSIKPVSYVYEDGLEVKGESIDL